MVLTESVKAASGGKTPIARAVAVGMTAVKLNIVSSTDQYADIEVGTTANLKSGSTGAAKIVWKESGTGLKWAIVRLGRRAASIRDCKGRDVNLLS